MKYQPIKLTTAQKLLVAMGWDSDLLFGHHRDLEAHPTKSGPGRKHSEGKGASRATPRNHGGAGPGFVLHKASSEKRARRALVQKHGRRQALGRLKIDSRQDRLNDEMLRVLLA